MFFQPAHLNGVMLGTVLLTAASASAAPTSMLSKPSARPATINTPVTVEPFALRQVELLDSPFKAAMERNAKVLLEINPDRLLHNTRQYAGLEPKAPLYGGWESGGIAGHTLGHYLTAISQQYAATGDPRFQERIAYIVKEMAEAQKVYGDGYIGALPAVEIKTMRAFKQGIVEPDNAFFFKGGAWVPWYTQHKVLAGLKDAWVLGKNAQAKEVTLRLADWVDDITRPLSHEQLQRMLQVEHGGMEEVLADIYALTGDRKYLETSRRFHHEAIMNPLLAGHDELAGKHANTQIPKVIGEARLFEVAQDENGRKIAEEFWKEVVHHHSYVIGGNSEYEHFGAPDDLADHLGPATAETCNTYNMLKLTRHLFEWQPKAEYFDFYERALYNHILGSQDPNQGQFTYFMSLKPGHFKTYSTLENSFWCCFGSGMENHTKYGESIYFHGKDDLYVNLFIPSRLKWEEKGLTVQQDTLYPRGNTTQLRFSAQKAVPLTIKVRHPAWATGGLKFELNGKPLAVTSAPGSYAEVRRTWKTDDVLKVTFPLTVRTEVLPGSADKVAFVYGPVVLAGDLGPVSSEPSVPYASGQGDNFNKPSADVPVLVTTSDPSTQVKRTSKNDLVFHTDIAAEHKTLTLRPFNEIFYNHYNVYWDVLAPAQYTERRAALEAETARLKELDARTLDEYRPGEQQSEIDHNQKGELSSSGDAQQRKYRHAEPGGWFSFDMKVNPGVPLELQATYWGGDAGRTFDILIDGQLLATETLNQDKPGAFFEKSYPIPETLTQGKQKVTVRFQHRAGSYVGGLFGARMLKRP